MTSSPLYGALGSDGMGLRVAALYVETAGPYFGIEGVDPWDQARDARLYDGPYPVVAHPPCQRWGDMWMGSPLVIARTGVRKKLGDDGGCFAAALAAVRKFGGRAGASEGLAGVGFLWPERAASRRRVDHG